MATRKIDSKSSAEEFHARCGLSAGAQVLCWNLNIFMDKAKGGFDFYKKIP